MTLLKVLQVVYIVWVEVLTLHLLVLVVEIVHLILVPILIVGVSVVVVLVLIVYVEVVHELLGALIIREGSFWGNSENVVVALVWYTFIKVYFVDFKEQV